MATKNKLPRVAIVTDWLFKVRGTEKLLDGIVELFPNCEIFALFGDKNSLKTLGNVENKKINFSILQKLPFLKSYYRYTYPLWPVAIETFDFKGFDLVISLSSSVAKGIIPPLNTPHISYINSPMRYAWDMKDIYFNNKNFSFIKRFFIPFFLHFLRIWDSTRNNMITYTIANSQFIKKRIEKFYNLKVDKVIYPFFDESNQKVVKKKDFYLYHGALEPNKGVVECVEAALKYNFKLVVSGNGSLEKRIKRMIRGKSNIVMKGWVSDIEKFKLMAQSKALLFPSIEDFGIVALEANSVGTPVLTLFNSGTSEFIKDKKNGILIEKQDSDEIYEGILKLEKYELKSGEIKKETKEFSRKKFQKELIRVVNTFLE